MIFESFRKTLGNVWKTLKTVQNSYLRVFMVYKKFVENLQKCLTESFGNFLKNFRSSSKLFLRSFHDF